MELKKSEINIAKSFSDVVGSNKVDRKDIVGFGELLKKMPNHFVGDSKNCPLKHTFSDGIYVREITIPKGMVIVGKIHKHEHPNFLLKGEVLVVTEDGEETIKAPCSMISKAGTKRALYAMTELVWTTVHFNPTNTRDLNKLEKTIIAESYNDYDKFIQKKDNFINKAKDFLIKTLTK